DYYLSYGLFDGNKLSNIIYKKVWSQFLAITNLKYNKPYINTELIDDKTLYAYDNELLFKYNLISNISEESKKTLILEDLVYCDDMSIIEFVARNVKEKYTQEEYTTHLNYLLKNISPKLNNYYQIIIWLIDNGACYELGDIQKVKDVSKTNFVYRVSKDMLFFKKAKQPVVEQIKTEKLEKVEKGE
ncbi:MAG: hypothetical protein IJW82_06950, partial [Clostridia bacterium]|nr:hypothetical protein [Clostridia bacterium]